jgi:hypothetical protein
MSRCVGMLCAAALVGIAAGCSANSFLLSFIGSDGKQQVVSGSVDQVSTNLQAALSNVGIVATLNKQGDDVRLAGVTKSGKRFALVLKQKKTMSGDSTIISLEWEKDADEQFWATVLELLTAPPPRASH